MISVSSLFSILVLLAALQEPQAAQNTSSPSRFVGTWVGVQSWAIDNPPPGAQEDQSVTLTIEQLNEQLVGTITPFFGGSDGASFVGGQIVGDQLQASGGIGKPQISTESTTFTRNLRGGWKESVRILFSFKTDRNDLTGTADVLMNGVKWLKFNYSLSRKRSRY